MSRKTLLHFFFVQVLAFSFIACCNCDDDYAPPFQGGVNTIRGSSLLLLDNSGAAEKPLYRNNSEKIDTVLKEAFGIKMGLLGSFYSFKRNEKVNEIPFISSAMACHCSGGYYSPAFYGDLENFKITSFTSFGNQDVAGSDLTDRFRIYKERNFLEIDQDSMTFDQFSTLLLMEPPAKSDTFRFVVEFDSNDTLHISDTTGLIYLF